MTDELPPLPPFDIFATGISIYTHDHMRAYAKTSRTPLLAEIQRLSDSLERVELYCNELREKLVAIVKATDRLNADTMYKWAPEAKDAYEKVRASIEPIVPRSHE